MQVMKSMRARKRGGIVRTLYPALRHEYTVLGFGASLFRRNWPRMSHRMGFFTSAGASTDSWMPRPERRSAR